MVPANPCSWFHHVEKSLIDIAFIFLILSYVLAFQFWCLPEFYICACSRTRNVVIPARKFVKHIERKVGDSQTRMKLTRFVLMTFWFELNSIPKRIQHNVDKYILSGWKATSYFNIYAYAIPKYTIYKHPSTWRTLRYKLVIKGHLSTPLNIPYYSPCSP
jgi:hypothetical protein